MTPKYYPTIIIVQAILLIGCLIIGSSSWLSFIQKKMESNSQFSNNSKIIDQKSFLPKSNTEQELIKQINDNYLRETPGGDKLEEAKNKGIIASLNDPYSEYITKADQVKFDSNLNQKYFGVGIKIDKVKDSIIVVDVLSGPAKEKGVQKGDIILKIENDLVVAGTTLSDVVSKIRGPQGTTIKLQFIRSGQAVDVELERKEIKGELINYTVDGDLAIIRISSFGEGLDARMKDITNQIKSNPSVKRIAIDVRSDTGGLLGEAIDVISYFVPANSVIVKERAKEKGNFKVIELRSKTKEVNLVNYPVAIMTDRFSASASEILAGALRDIRGTKLYGEKTFGKGLVQKIFPLSNGDYVKLTISEWLTPKDTMIDKIGLEPDVKADQDKDVLDKVKAELK